MFDSLTECEQMAYVELTINGWYSIKTSLVQSAETAEYTDFISAEE